MKINHLPRREKQVIKIKRPRDEKWKTKINNSDKVMPWHNLVLDYHNKRYSNKIREECRISKIGVIVENRVCDEFTVFVQGKYTGYRYYVQCCYIKA